MNSVVPKYEFIKSWTDNGIGWVQLNHENKLNPLSAGFILAIKAVSYTHLTLPTIDPV